MFCIKELCWNLLLLPVYSPASTTTTMWFIPLCPWSQRWLTQTHAYCAHQHSHKHPKLCICLRGYREAVPQKTHPHAHAHLWLHTHTHTSSHIHKISFFFELAHRLWHRLRRGRCTVIANTVLRYEIWNVSTFTVKNELPCSKFIGYKHNRPCLVLQLGPFREKWTVTLI